MTITAREAFERGTETFNAHDIDGFAEVLADDVVFQAPGGMSGQGKPACAEFYGGWLAAFPDGQVEVHGIHIIDDVAIEEGTFSRDPQRHPAHPDWRHTTNRPHAQPAIPPGAPLPGRQTRLVQPDVRQARDARTTRPHPCAHRRGLAEERHERRTRCTAEQR